MGPRGPARLDGRGPRPMVTFVYPVIDLRSATESCRLLNRPVAPRRLRGGARR